MQITVDNVTKRFGSRTILDQMSLSIPAGQTVALIGPSGGGKSTLLRCINGLNDFDEGAIQVGSHMLRARNGNDAACRPVRRLLGMVFQDFQLFPHLTALGNVMEGPTQVLHLTRRQARERGLALLERVGLADRAEFHPHQLSGGQKQRVAIARALAMEPKGLLCDEITSALDPELKNEVLNVLEDLKKDGMTLLMVTHEIGFARKAAEQVVVLAEGKVLEQGPPGEVLDHPKTSRLQQFLRRVLG